MAFVSSYVEVEGGKRGATRGRRHRCRAEPCRGMAWRACLSCLVLTFPPGAYIFHTQTLFPYLQDTTLSPLIFCRVALCSSLSRTSARTEIGRGGLWNPTPSTETPARVLRAIRFLGSVFHDCSPARSSSSTPADRDRLQRLRLLLGGRLRDCTANIFLHRLWSATSRNALCRLV